MTDASKSIAKKVQLLAKKSNGSKEQQSYEINAGTGDAGAPLRVKAESATRYELLDPKSERAPQHVRAKRAGRDLEIFLEGSETADIIIEQYYDEAIVEFPKDSLTGITGKGDLATYVIDEGLHPALSTLEGQVTPIILQEGVVWFNPWWGVAALGAAVVLPSNTAAAIGDLVITGSVTAGPVSKGVKLYAYDSHGVLLGTADIQSDGTFKIVVASRGDYRGAVLLKAMDNNAGDTNYLDEVTAADKSMGTTLRAMGVANVGQSQFTVNGLDAALVIHITPVTELAVLKAGITTDSAPADTALVLQTNQAVANVLGLNGVDITARPVATNSGTFNGADGLSDNEKYGLLLTKLSGLDSLNGGSLATSLTQLAQNISTSGTGSISAAGSAMLDQGRQQALNALITAPSSSEKTFTTDSVLNRQLLGDVIVTGQTLDANGKLVVSGTARPGSTVQVTLPDGTTQSAVADSTTGVFTLTSAAVQPTLETPLKLVGSDGLNQAALHIAPSAPQVDTGNGKLVSGTGTPGSIVTVTDSAGHVVGTATVDALGQWRFVPVTPLADNAVLKASAADLSGNVSGPGAGTVDVDQVSVRLAEAGDGYINAAEKASGGINFDIGLPATAHVGDTVSTVVTLPNGTTLTLVDVLTAAQIAAGTITRTLTPAQLATDGLYNAAISLVTQVGQSAPVRTGFIVDTTAPDAPNVSPSNGQIINGTAEVGTLVTVRDGAGNVIGTVGPVGADGNWTLLPAQPLPNGTVLSATATDVAGNTSGPGANNVYTGALLITGAIDNVGPQLGLLADGSATNDNSPQLAGTLGTALQTGQTLAVYRKLDNGTLVKVGVADTNGTAWTFQDGSGSGLNAPLADGNYTYQVVVETTAGPVNGLTPSGFFDLVINTARPAAPATTVPEATGADTFVNAAEKASDAGVPIVTQLAANARAGDVVTTTVTLPDGSTRVLSTTLKTADIQAGHISQLLTQSNLATDGAYSASTTLTSAVNGLQSLPTVNTFTLDTSAPIAGTGALASVSDTGTVGDNTTNDNTPTLSGTAEANATVQIVVNGQTYTVTANAQGVWTLPATATLPDGTYTPVITVTDRAGNSTTANGTPFTVDATAPATPGVKIPDASQGVSAAEAADGVALVVTLPADAKVGDTVTTVVTSPNGTPITLTHVIVAAELPAAQGGTATGAGPFTISQTVPQAQLLASGSTTTYLDGAWATSTTVTDTAGNTSAAQTDGFKLSANGPTLTLAAVAGDGTVNALEKAGDLPVSGTTTAEAGQPVTVQLVGANGTVIGTYYTTVQPDGSFALNIPQAALPADGSYTLKADVSNSAGTPAVQQTRPVVFDTTAPVVSVTSVAGDAVTASGDGTFDGTERGFDTNTYAPSNTVTTPPVISGTTTAEVGQTVNVLFNNVSTTTTVQAGGTWAITLTQAEAKALVHGNTYAISVSVSDVAGNPATPDTNNHMVVNIAPPDVPTIDQQFAGTTTPVITGVAQKLAAGNPIALANGDVLSFTVNGVTVTATVDSTQASGTSVPGVSYNPATKAWSLNTATAANFGLADDHTYDVQVNVTAAGVPARNDISAGELVLNTTPPVITLNPISPDASGASVINGFEQGQSVTLTGTTDAQVGATVTLTGLDGVPRTATVQAGVNGGPNTYSIPVPGTAISGLADGTFHPQVSVTNQFGLSNTATQPLLLDTTAPSAPTVALPEAAGGINAVEALSNGGTPLIVTLPADAKVGDTVTTVVTNPNGSTSVLTHVIAAGELPAAQGGTATGAGPFTITQTIASAALTVDGNWTTRTTVTDPAGNASAPQSGAFVLDTSPPGAPGVALPEALNGVNAAEALSNGGTPIAVTLPGDAAVGDTVATVVTLPDGSILTLSQVLTAADLTAGSISQLIPSSALTQDGNWATSTTVTDLAGNVSPARPGSFVLDTTPPAAPAAALAAISDSGLLGDSTTADSTPTVSGTGTPGDTITVTFPGGEVKTAVVAADGTWRVTPTTALADGVNNVSVTATDPAGNTSPATQLPITIDTTGPAAPTAALAPISDSGTLGDSLTNDNTPTLSGTGNPGDTITVKDAAGNVIATAVVNANGQWSATPVQALPDGLNTLAVTATDPAGNTGPAAALPITIDTSAPGAPAAVLAVASDSGTLGDSLTSDNTPAISGTGTAGDTIRVTFPGGEVQTVVVASNGTWTVTPTNALPDGLNTLSVTATDPAGNTSPATAVPVTIDTTPPAAPAADVAAASDTGASNTDNLTSDNTPTISGAGATPGDTITLYAPNGTTVLGTAVVAAGGTWAITPTTALAEGLSNLSVKATDPAGNVSAATPVPVTIDTTVAVPDILPTNGQNALSGTGEPGATVTIKNGSTVIGTAVVAADGTWSLPLATALADSVVLSATQVDPAGNVSAPGTETVTAGVPLIAPSNGSALSGTGKPGDQIALTLNGQPILGTNGQPLVVTVAPNGTWVATPATPLANGAVVVATDTLSHLTATTTVDSVAPTAPAAVLAAVSDSGTLGDSITNDTTPTISGAGGTPGDTITVTFPGGETQTAVVDANGNWAVTPTTALPQGLNTLSVTATDPAGNVSAATALPVTIDSAAPAAPTAVLNAASDSGTLGDSKTNDTTPTLSGTGEPNATITVKDANGNVIATAVVDGSGNWSATPTNALPQGVNNLAITATDAAGNTSAPAALPITIDTTAPVAPVAALAAGSDTGIAGDAITADNTPTITGTGTPGDTITLYAPNGTTVLGTAVVASNGSWSVTPTTALTDGLQNLQVKATDPAGNTGPAATVPVTIDTTAPAAPAAALASVSDSGTLGDAITSDTTPTITGAAATPGDTITLKAADGTVLGTAVVAANGTWAITPTAALPDGLQNFKVTATDPQGNVSAETAVPVTIDTTAPAAPVAALASVSDSGTLGDNLTNDTTPTLSGTGTPGDTITVKDAAGNVIATATVGNNGTWAATPTNALPQGLNNLAVTATDPAGNTSAPTTVPVTIDTSVAAPAISPTNGIGAVSGTGEPGATVTLMSGSTVLGTAVVAPDGTWSVPLSAALPDTTALSATAVDPAGNTSAPGTTAVNTAVPDINPTNGTTLAGTGKPFDTIALTLADGTVLRDANGAPLTAVVDANGNWSATPGTPLPDGAVVKATDTTSNLSATQVVDALPPAAPAAALAAISDSGTLGDSTTNDTTPTLSGTGTPGDTITVKDAAGNVIATAVVGSNGQWAATPTAALPQGLNNLAVTATDPVGNVSAATAVPVTIDTTAPSAPAVALTESPNGISAAEAASLGGTPIVTTLPADAKVGDTVTTVVTNPNGTTTTLTHVIVAAELPAAQGGTATGSGPFTISQVIPSSALTVDGAWTTSTTVTDTTGNTSAATAGSFVLDTTAPSAPAVALPEAANGISAAEVASAGGTPIVTTLPADAKVGDTVTTVVTNPNGTTTTLTHVIVAAELPAAQGGTATGAGPFTISQVIPSSALTVDGNWTTITTVTDVAGNTSPATAGAFTLDTTAPSAPAVALPEAANGISAAEAASAGGTPIVTTLPADAKVGDTVTTVVTNPNGTTTTLTHVIVAAELPAAQGGTATGAGPFTISQVIPSSALTVDGAWTSTTTVTDVAGNTSPATAGAFTLDTTAPAAPAAALASSSDSGTLGDGVTNDTTPTLSGTGTPGDTITVTFPGGETATVVVASNGSWSVTPVNALPQGVNNIAVTATDPAGNTGPASTVPVTIDTSAAAPVIGATNGSGALTGTGEPGATVTVTDAQGTVIGTALVAPNGSWSVTPAAAIPDGTVLSAAQVDAAGNASAPGTQTVNSAMPLVNPTNGTALAGTGKPGDTVALTLVDGTPILGGNGQPLTALVDSNGNWTATPGTPIANGAVVKATDTTNNMSGSATVDATPPAAPAAALAAISDSGTLGDGKTTDTTPTLSGTGTPGDSITVKDANGTTIATAVVDANGNWAATPTTALPEGLNTLAVTATDPVGNVSAPTSVPVTIDTTAPAAPVAALASVSDSGTQGDGKTTDTTPTLSGTGTVGDTITVKDAAGNVIATAVVDANGNWSATPTTALPEGVNNLAVTATDPAGNTSAATALPVTIDTTAPAAPVAALAAISDSGTLGDSKTNDTTPTLSGTGTPNDTITVKDAAGNVIATAVVDANGNWSATPTTALPQGVNNLAVTATDPAGNTSAATAVPVTIDTTAPAAPAAALAAISDSGTLGDSKTNDTTPTLSGTGTPGDTITVKDAAGNVIATAVVGSNGQWAATPAAALPEGLNTLAVTATDPAGNVSAPTSVPVTIDTTAPAAPVAALAAISDSGTQGDGITNDTTPTLSGTGTVGDTITVKDAAGTVIATAVVDANGNWSATPTTALPQGVNNLSVTATDPAGNTSAATAVPVTIDTTAAAPVIGATNGSGALTGTGEPGATVTVTDAQGGVIGTALVAPNGSWSVTPAATLPDGTVLSAAQVDAAGNTSAPAAQTVNSAVPVVNPTNGTALAGTGKPGDTVALTLANGTAILGGNGQPLTALVDSNGNWTATPGTPIANGAVVKATDTTSNLSGTATVDATPPAAPAAALAAISDSGTLGDSTTNDTTPTLSGTGTPGDAITVKDANGTTIATAVVGSNGQWTATPSAALPEGLNTLAVTATDPVGNVSAPTSVPVTIDTTGPTAPAVALPEAANGISAAEAASLGGTPIVTTLPADAKVGDTVTTVVTNPNGTTSTLTHVIVAAELPAAQGGTASGAGPFTISQLIPSSALTVDGAWTTSTTVTDASGNASAATAGSFVLDTTPPAVPVITPTVTADTTPIISGTATLLPGETMTVTVNGATYNVTVGSNGNWNLDTGSATPASGTLAAFVDGQTYNVTATVTDAAGNSTTDTSTGEVRIDATVVDTTPPAAPAGDVAAASDSGSSNTDNLTNVVRPVITGTAEPGATIKLYAPDGTTLLGTTVAAGDGTWAITPNADLAQGLNNLRVTATDAAGNTSAPGVVPVTLDTTGPSAPTVALPEAPNSVSAAEAASLGGTPIVTTLASDVKVGDTVTTVVTNPNGTTTTLTHVVLASEVPAAQGGTATGSGPFTISQVIPSSALTVQGAWTTSTTITDTAGNTSTATAGSFTLDLTPPAAPTAVLATASDTGTVGDGITSDTTPTISGTGTNGDTITVVMPGSGEVLTAVVVGGVWSVTPTYALTDGTVGNAVVTATDPAGNVSAPANVPLDIRSSPVNVAITSITTDTGISSTDGITTDTTPTISGTSDQPNRPVTVTIAGVSFTVMTDSSGNWTVDTGALAATSGTWNKAVGFTTDGLKAITVTVAGGNGGTGTATGSVTLDTTAPTVLVTSVFGDAVGASGNGTFDGTERGFNTTTYTLNSTVAPLPVISGTTTAENGQVVTVTLAGKSYTATAASGAWSVSVPSADAVLLNHGNTYAISASVSDKAGNAAVADTNNGLLVNIAAPDVPTVVSQTTLSTTPTITGLAQKLNGSSTVNLATGDVLTVVIQNAATTTLGTYTLTVGGTSSPAGLSYNSTSGAWSLAVPASVLPAGAATYDVNVSTTAAGLTRSDISSHELVIAVVPTITSIPEGPTVNMTEAASSGGTPVNVGLTGTGAVAGQVITVNWGGQTFTQVLTAADIAANSVAVIVPTSVMQAETPANTTESINVTVSLGNGITSAATSVAINFVTPTAPIISNTAWSTTNTTSTILGIPEAQYDRQFTGFTTYTGGLLQVDNQLYYSEAVASGNSGTIMRVQLPTTGTNPPVAGDTLTVTWGNQVLSAYTITSADLVSTAKYVDITVPFSAISAQAYGTVPVTAVVTSAASGNSSPAASVNVTWAYDMPMDNLASLSAGFAINGRTASSQTGSQYMMQGVVSVGDVNGDGFDDFTLVENTGGAKYVVYGRAGLTSVELSTMSTVGSTNGFIISGGTYYNTTAGDYNGDGLNDILVQDATTGTYVVLGSTASPGAISVATMASSQGFKITSNYNVVAPTFIGDVNGDGLDDMIVNFEVGASGVYGNYVLYGSTNTSAVTLPTGLTGTFSNGFFINTGNTSLVSGGRTFAKSGDFNGDGYSDFVLNTYNATNAALAVPEYVFFGGPNLTGITSSSMSVAGTGRGFAIVGLTGNHQAFYSTTTGDINGDGLDDMIFNDNATNAYVLFGKTSDAPVQVSNLAAGSGGFVINGTLSDVDVVGDFNGDGLADMVVTQTAGQVNGSNFGTSFLIYGRTATSAITLSNVAPSEGFRIDGPGNAGSNFGQSVSAGGDINGDGFADLIITAPADDPTAPARTDAGITRVIFGGPTALNSMTFQALNGDAIGTTGADTLTGTSGANQIVAGDGNDTLVGAGGADVLYGGRGDDTIVVNASNIAALATNSGNAAQAIARIDGGNGTDTLEITASLDLNTIRPAAIQSIERINMSAGGTSLTMGLLDVLGLSEKNNPFNTATGWTATSTGGATGWGTVNVGAQVVVDGTASNDLYLSGTWQSIGTVTNNGKTYKVLSDLTNAEAQVIVDSNVKVHLAPTILTTANELPNTLNFTEATDGTLIKLSLTDTDAASGNTITLNWGGQTISVTLTAADITAGFVNVPVTLAKLTAETPSGTSEAVAASVTLLSGSTVVAQSGAQAIDVNFITPTTPIIAAGMAAATLWSTTNTTSSLAGIPEAYFGTLTTTMPTAAPANVDNALWYSEAVTTGSVGTVLRVALPTATPGTVATNAPVPTLAGDTVTVVWGDQTLTATVSATNITNRYVDFTVTQAQLESQTFGNVTVTASVTSAASGNTSLTSPLVVNWNYDLPLDQLASLSQGFQIDGKNQMGISNENQGASNVGDVNGDGFDDIEMTDLSGTRYVVYGGNRLGAVNVSQMSVAGNSFGFIITGSGVLQPTRGGDINGDGLSDLLIGNGANSYIVFGKATSIGQVALTSLGTNGFAFTSTSSINEPSVVGDVNGDGYEDILFNNSTNFTNYLVFGGTNFTPGGSVALPTGTSGSLTTGTGTGATYVNISNGGAYTSGGILPTLHGDFNGDGYSDFALAQSPTTGIGTGPVYVYYGSSTVAAWNSATLTSPTNLRGFVINGLTGQNSVKFSTTNAGDINGDGLDDIAFSDGTTRAFVMFGKTNSTSVNVSDLAAGNGGFIMSGGTVTDTDVVGDFNGDGLADMVVSNESLSVGGSSPVGGAYLVYGRTATTALTLDALTASEGFRIDGPSALAGLGNKLGRTAIGGGDINGDGLADLVITTYSGETVAGVASSGITRVIYGGVDKIESMVFQTANGDAMGTTGADTLNGTSGNNQLVGGDGNDTLTGNGGADVLYGGRGDDLIVANADNVAKLSLGGTSQAIARVDGGSGIDTFKLDGAGIMLDLSLVSGPAIQNIEKIDLTGSGNNTLKLSLTDMLQSFDNSNVFNSSNTTSGLSATVSKNQLLVDGDAGDKVVLTDLTSWTASGTNVVANGHTYTAYNHNTSAQQLLIDQLLTVSAT